MRSRFLDLCVALALLVSLPGAWPQSKGINPVLLAKANDGDAKSQSLIGEAYLNGFSKDGINVPQDFTLAEFWCRKQLSKARRLRSFDMGVLYLRGLGVPQDNGKAADWFLKAANQGYARAQYQLATLFEEGQGRIQSHALAATFYRKAAEQGDAEAQFALGLLYDNGNGVPQDFTQRRYGIERQPNRDMLQHNLTLASCTSTAKANHEAMQKPISGWTLHLLEMMDTA